MNQATTNEVEVEMPDWGWPIWADWWTYWFLHGGRGSAKTQTTAMGLILRGADTKIRVVCFRAVQNNVDESVRQELVDAIYRAELQDEYDIKEKYIKHRQTGTRFTFRGMQKPGSLRGLAGVDIVWIDEAQDVSAKALRSLIPSIRKATAQLIFTFNPIAPEDAVWQWMLKFVLPDGSTAKDAIIMEKNWRDNPWFPEKLEADRQRDLARDPMEYMHTWEGKFWQRSDSVIFANCCEFDLEFDSPEPWETDTGRYYYGADFGYAADPSTLTRCFIKDGYLWIDYAEFGYHVELDALGDLYDRVPGAREWPIGADCARPDVINLVKRQGFQISGAEKGKDSIEAGITFMRSFKGIKVHKRCPYIAQEFMKYSWKVDPKTDQVLPIIVDAWNHGIDATRYSLVSLIKAQGAYILDETELGELDVEDY